MAHCITTLVLIPTQAEFDSFVESLALRYRTVDHRLGSLPLVMFDGLPLNVGIGGLGKVQFAVRSQRLLDLHRWSCFVCAGAAGTLTPAVRHHDVVVGTETIEHDIRKVSRPLVPRYKADPHVLATCRAAVSSAQFEFNVHFGPIASGDEDIVCEARRSEIAAQTQALVVAWEGAGAGAACDFSAVPFVELRGVADSADSNGPNDFHRNLRAVMSNVAAVAAMLAVGLA